MLPFVRCIKISLLLAVLVAVVLDRNNIISVKKQQLGGSLSNVMTTAGAGSSNSSVQEENVVYYCPNMTLSESLLFEETQSQLRRLNLTGVDLFRYVHSSDYPALLAGRWMCRPDQALHPSREHLMCLDTTERQGNCNNDTANRLSKDKARKSRLVAMEKDAVINSPGILTANDPWVWESNIEEYKILSYDDMQKKEIQQLLGRKKVHMIGDSLTRQWAHTMGCEFEHVFGSDRNNVRFIACHKDMTQKDQLREFLNDTTPEDYIILNFGHHVGPAKLKENWKKEYQRIILAAMTASYEKVPRHHVFFRSTTIRHFLYDHGDWDTLSGGVSGGVAPNMTAQWLMYGGNYREQPEQNLFLFDVWQQQSQNVSFFNHIGQILDTSPMTLARADASFDGSHLCLPGPMDYWSRMLYYRIYKHHQEEKKQQQI